VLGQVLRLTAAGLAIGLALFVAASGLLRSILFEVQPTDPATMAAVAVTLASVAVFAGWWPAWRASRINPVAALRSE